jgi:hypothetical protein
MSGFGSQKCNISVMMLVSASTAPGAVEQAFLFFFRLTTARNAGG